MNAEQIVIATLVATLLVQAIKVLIVWNKITAVNPKVLSVILLVIAIGLSAVWLKPVIVPAGVTDPLLIIEGVLVAAGAVFGLAKLVYEFLLKWAFDKLGLNTDPLIARNIDRLTPPAG